MKPYVPAFVGTVTKYVFIESPEYTPSDLALRAYEISEGLMIKETCFGLQVTGSPDEVVRVVTQLRRIDPSHIFVKDRGFPPGDPRRCRANLGGARPGYYGHEFEVSSVIPYVSHGLEVIEGMDDKELKEFSEPEVMAGKAGLRIPDVLDVKRLKELIDAEEL